MRWWMCWPASSSRSSDSTSSHRPPPSRGEPAQERLVDGGVDADGVHADAGQPRRQRVEELILVADLAVGEEYEHTVAVVVPREQFRRRTQRLHHLGAAARTHLREVLDRAEPVAVRGLHQPGPSVGGCSTTLSKVSAVNRSVEVRVSTMRAAARRPATIFQPDMLPDRSSTITTSRGRAGAAPPAAGP